MKTLLAITALLLMVACTDTPTDPAAQLAGSRIEAPTASARAEAKMLPFHFKGTWWRAEDGDPNICDDVEGTVSILFLEWEGTATHMGASRGVGANCYGPGEPFARTLLAQVGTIHAANGDELYLFGAEPTVVVNPDLSFYTGPVNFVGGTGRFENAVGWYGLYGPDIIAAGPFTLEGEISSVGSGR